MFILTFPFIKRKEGRKGWREGERGWGELEGGKEEGREERKDQNKTTKRKSYNVMEKIEKEGIQVLFLA